MFGRYVIIGIAAFAGIAGRSACAEGEFEAEMRRSIIEGYIDKQSEFGLPADPIAAEKAADCVVGFGMLGVSLEERELLDAWAAGGPEPEDALVRRVFRELTMVTVSGMCTKPASTTEE